MQFVQVDRIVVLCEYKAITKANLTQHMSLVHDEENGRFREKNSWNSAEIQFKPVFECELCDCSIIDKFRMSWKQGLQRQPWSLESADWRRAHVCARHWECNVLAVKQLRRIYGSAAHQGKKRGCWISWEAGYTHRQATMEERRLKKWKWRWRGMSSHSPVCASCPHTTSADLVDKKDEEGRKLRSTSAFKYGLHSNHMSGRRRNKFLHNYSGTWKNSGSCPRFLQC